MPLPGMTPELEARCRSLGLRYCETFLRWYRTQSKENPALQRELTTMLERIRRGEITRAELGDVWTVMAAGTLDYIARGEKDTTRARFGLVPPEKPQ